ncbi:hypothetical protein RJ639_032119 [Escallonia herrerae]|uniref:Uncharacterized protein n=1 Tax=Escallonia herrerae TaxID=1293975 RepID=A0AA89BC55_9ASTE|nr:hypothetical protein RJ639_032119 [Escallonia herrerae]
MGFAPEIHVKALVEVEAFALRAEDFKFVANQFRCLHSKKLQHTFRFYSHHWRTWAACFIQAAWRRYKRRMTAKDLTRMEECGDTNGFPKKLYSGASYLAIKSLNMEHRFSTGKKKQMTARLILFRQQQSHAGNQSDGARSNIDFLFSLLASFKVVLLFLYAA